MWNRKVFIRIIEVLLCIATVVTLRVTDDESRRVFHYLRSRSREWSLLNNVTWGAIGAALATATCGGYVIITTGLLVAAATGELRGRKTELFFLGLGIILFGIVGALSLASIENVPEDLVDNAAVFGALCLLTALVFIADLLISTPKKKEKPGAMQNFGDKDIAVKRQTTTVTTEKESKTTKSDDTTTPSKLHDNNGNINNGFEKIDDQHQKNARPEKSDDVERVERDSPSNSNHRSKDVYHVDEDRNFDRVERQPKEYTQNFENGRALRDSQRYRDPEMQRHRESEVQRYRDPDSQRSTRMDSHDNDHRMDVPTIIYKSQDIYQRPVDEVDTPRFPIEMNGRTAPMFAKIVNPGVKIMRVEHDVDEAYDAYRYSDMSQYDNVPIRMRGTTSPGILKKNRDVSFNVPPPPKGYAKGHEKTMDEIEMLEECFGSLRTTTTGTQTGVRTPSSPTDPGYVRHTASNWPQELKTKTPSSSPNHTQN